MTKSILSLVGISMLFIGCASTPPPAESGLTFKDAKKNVNLYDHRSPFDDTKKVGLASINLRFMNAERGWTEKRGTGSAVTWAILGNLDREVFQEIADEYYARLAQRFASRGIQVTDDYAKSKHFKTMVDDNKKNPREVFDKDWGVAEIFTAKGAPYIEYGSMAFGAHARIGNEQEYPVGQMFINIDFAEILQKVSKHSSLSDTTLTANTSIQPMISITPPTMGGIKRAFAAGKGDGTYALFQGDNWGATNVNVIKPITSSLEYATSIEKAEGMPEIFRKHSGWMEDMLTAFSGGRANTGRGSIGEFVFIVQPDREKYKAAVLDALDKWNDHLFLMIDSTK